MTERTDVPSFFVYGESSRALGIGFLHVETVMQRKSLHYGRVAPHRHPAMGQVTFWFRGGGTYRIEDRSWRFSAPAVGFVPSSVVHGFDVDDRSDAVVVSVSDDKLRAIAPEVGLDLDAPAFVPGAAGDPSWERLERLLFMVAAEYREGGANGDKLLSSLFCAVLSLIGRLGGAAAPPTAAAPEVALAFALRRSVDLHYRADWTVPVYVEALTTTPHLLDKAARNVFGMSVKAMIGERRLLEAKRLLLFTIRPVEDVGREVGFEDPAYFSRFFRARTGLSPTRWRHRSLAGESDTPG